MPHSEVDQPLAKRQRLIGSENGGRTSSTGSRIFTPYRSVGLVNSTDVPFTSIPLGKTTFQITTSVGQSLHTYDLKRGLNLTFITRPQTPSTITATYAWKDSVYTAFGDPRQGQEQAIWVFKRGKKVGELAVPTALQEPIRQLLIFGSWIVGCGVSKLEIWKTANFEHYTTLQPIASRTGDNELTGGMCNMPTFLNKLFVGRKNGWVEIWNVSTGKLIYTILPPSSMAGSVTCLEPTPALSMLAISYSAGPLCVKDVLLDKTLVLLNAGTEDQPVHSISFRTDGRGAGSDGRLEGVMATATRETGDVTLWDLNDGGRVMGILRSAHNPPSRHKDAVGGGISKAEFLPGQPVLVTSGLDNALKSWIFDETPFSAVPRILHSRSGHAAPVSCLDFLPSDFDGAEAGNKWLLSGGRDRSLWAWSLRRDGQSTELSQGNIQKKAKKAGILATSVLKHGPTTTLDDLKAPEITGIACSLNRDGGIGAMPGKQAIWQKGQTKTTNAEVSAMTGWESVVTAHKDDPFARTWFWGRKRAGRWAFQTGDGMNVSTVTMSPCGTFALVGSEGGALDMFNLQSGQHRQRFPSRLTPAQARQMRLHQLKQADAITQLQSRSQAAFTPGSGRHTAPVTGIVVDSMNKMVISCSLDGKVKFWEFLTGNLIDQLDWSATSKITSCQYHPANDLIGLSCDDGSIRVVDLETRTVIRELWGCQGIINDFCFSSDGRWLVAASQDSIMRVWDLPTSHLIDAVKLESPCKALAFSGTGEYLATAHEGELGVLIWTNKSAFKHVSTRNISNEEIAQVSNTITPGQAGQGLLEAAFEEDDDAALEATDEAVAPSLDQLSAEMTTLSLVPKSRWQTLLHLDLIKQRNKPVEPPKAPEKAPFFLPSLNGEKSKASDSSGALTTIGTGEEGSRISKRDWSRSEEEFSGLLRRSAAAEDYDPFLEHLKSLPPSAADLELRSLTTPLDLNSSTASPDNELLHFIKALTARLVARRDYELIQAWMTVFLRLHSETIMESEILLGALREWRLHHKREKERLDDLVGYCGGVIGFLRSPRT